MSYLLFALVLVAGAVAAYAITEWQHAEQRLKTLETPTEDVSSETEPLPKDFQHLVEENRQLQAKIKAYEHTIHLSDAVNLKERHTYRAANVKIAEDYELLKADYTDLKTRYLDLLGRPDLIDNPDFLNYIRPFSRIS